MANTYKALSTVTVGAGGASGITFSNIPATYTDLKIVVSARSSAASVFTNLFAQINGDSSANYNSRMFWGNGATVQNDTSLSSSFLYYGPTINAANSTSTTFSNCDIYIPNYVSSNTKSISFDGVSETNATTAYTVLSANSSAITNPITSVYIYPSTGNFVQYSTATLYGVFNADVSSAPATPTIGTATAGAGQASITYTGVSNAASYTMTSTPGSIAATGTTSPITVTGLTNGTAYTFKVKSNNPFGSSAESAASNSVTPIQADFESIASLPGGNASLTFNSIPSTYKHLQIRFFARNDGATGPRDIRVRFNGDTNANYRWHSLRGLNTTLSSSNSDGVDLPNYLYWGVSPSANNGNTTTIYGVGIVEILDYASTSKTKTIRVYQGYQSNTSNGYAFMLDGHWNSTSAISSIFIESQAGSFTNASSFALYGIKG